MRKLPEVIPLFHMYMHMNDLNWCYILWAIIYNFSSRHMGLGGASLMHVMLQNSLCQAHTCTFVYQVHVHVHVCSNLILEDVCTHLAITPVGALDVLLCSISHP